MKIGAHVSSSGGLSTSIGRAQAIGAEAMQVFLCAPQRWQEPRHTDEEIARFRDLAREAGIGPNFVHAIYLINLASADPTIRERSIAALSACTDWAGRCGLDGVVVHVGSAKNQPLDEAEASLASALESVLAATSDTPILLENSAGAGNNLGARFAWIGQLIHRLGDDPRLGVCLDTAHSFASGYDLREADTLDAMVEEIEGAFGVDRLRLVHANDSKAGLGSALDRHENIGDGQIGAEAFERMLAHPGLRHLPWVLEVPGYADDGPDLRSVDTLRRLAGRVPALTA